MLPHDCGWPLPPTVPTFASLDARDLPPDADQIEKDLHRAGRLELGVADADVEAHYAALRSILRAWCWASTAGTRQSYSQAMSRVGATLLVAVENDAERAFLSFAWLMRSLPRNYYDTGYLVDVRALRLLAAWRWPESIVPALYEPLEMVSSTWFLSLWAGVLPQECCVAVWAQMIRDGLDDSEEGDQAAARAAPAGADTSLRVGLLLLEAARPRLDEAVVTDREEADANVSTEDAPAFGAATYTALQQVAQWQAADAASLVSAALKLELSSEAVAEARQLAGAQLRAEENRRAQEKAAARALAKENERRRVEGERREADRVAEVKSTSTRLGEQQHEEFEAEVEEAAAKKAAKREVAGARNAYEAQTDDLRVAGQSQERSSVLAAVSPASFIDQCGSLGRVACECLLFIPLILVACVAILHRLGRRLFGWLCHRVSDAKRRSVRRAPLSAKDEERGADQAIEMSDAV